ncbi:MAG: hypothetical protein MRJ92_01565 [Nitrospira sp.]|nr:hypothetical protein [Nitrospira sp.]
MALYSEQYDYHGLKKSDMRKVWADLFDEFQDLTYRHFSKLARSAAARTLSSKSPAAACQTQRPAAYVSRSIVGMESSALTFEDGQWRIRGNVGDSPRLMPFGTSPHPLF